MIIAVFILVILNILATVCIALLLIRRTGGVDDQVIREAVRSTHGELRQDLSAQRGELRQTLGEVRTEIDAKFGSMADGNARRHLQLQTLMQEQMDKLRAAQGFR